MLKAGKSKLLIVPVVFIGFLTSVLQAGVDISGFVDVIYKDSQGENSSFGMGAFEIDFETEISESAVFEGAVVVEEDGAALGQWKPEVGDKIERTTLAVGCDIAEGISVRGEYQINKEKPEADNNAVTAQVVVSF